MRRALLVGVVAFTLLVLLVALAVAFALGRKAPEQEARLSAPPSAGVPRSTTTGDVAAGPAAPSDQGFLYGRVTTLEGSTLEGRLRFGGAEEAFWSDHFNGSKEENPWRADAPIEQLPKVHDPITIFGFQLLDRVRPPDLRRPFMARFGDITRIQAKGKSVRVTLKGGTIVTLDRFGASDFDDGVRVWDRTRGVVDLDSLRIHTIELLPTPQLEDVPSRLHGTVRTRQGDFTGFIRWNRSNCVGTDELRGRAVAEVDDQTAEGDIRLRFDTLRSIARHSAESVRVTLLDGREIVLSGSHVIGDGNRPGVYVEDRRYGGVLIPWETFERLDFTPAGSGAAYADFPPAQPITGSVLTRAGQRLAGRLVYDLDESETNETVDAPRQGVNYNIPFGLIASMVLPAAGPGADWVQVTLQDGETLQLEPEGDFGEGNTGLLVFVDGRPGPEYVPWGEVARIDLDRPQAMYPPSGVR